jgi:hypothetical protein
MKQEFKEKPSATWLETLNAKTAIIHFSEDIKEAEKENQDGEKETYYTAETYQIEAVNTDNLLERVEKDRDIWLSAAKEKETESENRTLYQRVSDLETTVDTLVVSSLM